MSKTDLTWLKTLIENYKKEQQKEIIISYYQDDIYYFEGKIDAANEILNHIKIFIKEANKLTEK